MDKKELESFSRSELFAVAKKYHLRGLTLLTKNKIIEKIVKAAEKEEKGAGKTPPQKIQEATYQRAETKFYTPSGELQRWPKTPSGELPSAYGDNKIVLMVRDPWWLYAYWEISAAKHDEVKRQMETH